MHYSLEKMSADYIGLAWNFHVSPDSCSNPAHYENYLRLCAVGDQKEGMGVTHIMLEWDDAEKASAIIGFITLRATSLTSNGEDGKQIVNPSLEIAELAVDEKFEKQGFGRQLVEFAIYAAATLREELIGIKYIVLCAAEAAVSFYEKLEFGKINELFETPRDGWNNDCEPMYISLAEP